MMLQHKRRFDNRSVDTFDSQARGRIARAAIVIAAHQQDFKLRMLRAPVRHRFEGARRTSVARMNRIAQQHHPAALSPADSAR